MAIASPCSSRAISTSGLSMSSAPLPRADVTPLAAAARGIIAESSALDLTLRVLRPWLARSDVTELCINRPGEAYLETRSGWECAALPFADLDWCRRLAKLVANSTAQRVDEES